jgi:hypothetical protein
MLLTFPSKDLLVKKAYQEPLFEAVLLISNHRSLADWSLIPLSRICVVLGPNSAGKSSIFEALDILTIFITQPPYSSPDLDLILESSRAGGSTPAYGLCAKYPADSEEIWEYLSTIEDSLIRDVRSSSKEGDFPVFGRIFNDKEFGENLKETVYTVLFENVSAKSLDVSIYIDGQLAGTWIARDGHQKIRIKSFVKKFFIPDPDQLTNIFDQDADFSYDYYLDGFNPFSNDGRPAWPSFVNSASFTYQASNDESIDPRLADEAFALITALFHYPIVTLIRKHAWTLGSSPIRDLDSDWFFCDLGYFASKKNNATYHFKKNPGKKRDSGKNVLAVEAIIQEIAKFKDPRLPDSTMLARINEWIGGKAFLDSGYQIKVGLKICVPTKDILAGGENAYNLKEKFEITEGSYGNTFRQLDQSIEFLARIYLTDKTGRELRFTEVGTGFSQILPILTFLNYSSNYIVRQPELHLHPKLQSRVADCIVSRIADDRKENLNYNIMVETHSEHIVLRFLRRIRDSYKDPLLHTSLTLYPTELALIYVKPEADKSKVFLIRVDSSGEFIDGWPEGFFDERDEDLWG